MQQRISGRATKTGFALRRKAMGIYHETIGLDGDTEPGSHRR